MTPPRADIGWPLRGEQRRTVHMVSEAAALGLALPLSVYAAASPRLPAWARLGFGLVAVATAVIDSALLGSYLSQRKQGNNNGNQEEESGRQDTAGAGRGF